MLNPSALQVDTDTAINDAQIQSTSALDNDPNWFKNAVFYEIQPRAFHDSNGDGIGDLNGITEKLDYLQWLGVDAIWLTPFYQSPFRDGGYDISNFYDIHPDFGTLEDFSHLVEELHRRNMRVLIDLVLNHTSDEHPWFMESRLSRDNPKADWYVWSDANTRYPLVRCVFKDLNPEGPWRWIPEREQYVLHRFHSFQPDLNYENPEVQMAMLHVVHYWLTLGVDGFRLDAVTRLFEEEDSESDGLPQTHAFLKHLRKTIDEVQPNCILLAEADGQPVEVMEYFGDGDECHMNLHFPVMPQIFYGLAIGSAQPIANVIKETPVTHGRTQWGTFLRNHDELACAYLTEEQRIQTCNYYAPDGEGILHDGVVKRLFPLLKNDRRKAELLYAILLSLPGSPFLYYGDEIGMASDSSLFDRDGLRTPMQWNNDINAGFSTAPGDRLYLPVLEFDDYPLSTVNVEAQQNDLNSFLHWCRAAILFRKHHPQMGLGTPELLPTGCDAILSYSRQANEDIAICLHNLSDQTQEFSVAVSDGTQFHDQLARDAALELNDTSIIAKLGPFGYAWITRRVK